MLVLLTARYLLDPLIKGDIFFSFFSSSPTFLRKIMFTFKNDTLTQVDPVMWVYTGVIDQVYFLNVNLHKFKISHLLIFFHKDAFWLFIKLFKKCKIIHSVTSKHCFGTTWAKNYRSSTPNFFLMILSQINALYDADRSSVIYNE